MGALCGKESRDENFAGPGRRLDSPPEERATAPLPSNKRVVGGPPRTLGSPSTASGGASAADAAEARRRVADATIARAEAADNKAATGKLGSQLQQQKKQTMDKTMRQAAEDEARRKEIVAADQQLTYN